MDASRLPALWRAAWHDAGLPFDARAEALGERLLDAWAEPQRHYHTQQHLAECLALAENAEASPAVRLALWFHDAVYEPRAPDNEARSADWARAELETRAPADPDLAARVHALILATRHGTALETAPDADTRELLDIDLAVLGAGATRFDEYDGQIRREYAFVPEDIYRAKRAEVLRGFLERPQIYQTDALAARFEAPARANLARALARLAA